MNFAKEMDKEMTRADISNERMAIACKVKASTVDRVRRGVQKPTDENKYKYALALGFDMKKVFPEDSQMTIGKWARLHRLRRGYTRKRLSEESGVTEPTIYKLESDGGAINMYSLIELANVLKIGIDEYIGRRVNA